MNASLVQKCLLALSVKKGELDVSPVAGETTCHLTSSLIHTASTMKANTGVLRLHPHIPAFFITWSFSIETIVIKMSRCSVLLLFFILQVVMLFYFDGLKSDKQTSALLKVAAVRFKYLCSELSLFTVFDRCFSTFGKMWLIV